MPSEIAAPAQAPTENASPPTAAAAPPADPPQADGTEGGGAPDNAALERDEKGKFKSPAQQRIDELTTARRQAEREAKYWRELAAAKEPPEPEAPKKPVASDYGTYDEYVEALADFKADQKIEARFAERDQRQQQQSAESTRQSSWERKMGEAEKGAPGLRQRLAASDAEINEAVGAALYESEFGPQIADHLAQHPELAEKLNAMSATAAVLEIGRLSQRFDAPPAEPGEDAPPPTPPPAPEPTRRATNAPPPARGVTQGRSTAPDLAKLGMEEYVKQRKKDGASWAR